MGKQSTQNTTRTASRQRTCVSTQITHVNTHTHTHQWKDMAPFKRRSRVVELFMYAKFSSTIKQMGIRLRWFETRVFSGNNTKSGLQGRRLRVCSMERAQAMNSKRHSRDVLLFSSGCGGADGSNLQFTRGRWNRYSLHSSAWSCTAHVVLGFHRGFQTSSVAAGKQTLCLSSAFRRNRTRVLVGVPQRPDKINVTLGLGTRQESGVTRNQPASQGWKV